MAYPRPHLPTPPGHSAEHRPIWPLWPSGRRAVRAGGSLPGGETKYDSTVLESGAGGVLDPFRRAFPATAGPRPGFRTGRTGAAPGQGNRQAALGCRMPGPKAARQVPNSEFLALPIGVGGSYPSQRSRFSATNSSSTKCGYASQTRSISALWPWERPSWSSRHQIPSISPCRRSTS